MDQRYTVTLPPGVVRNDSAYAVKGRYVNSNFVRFWEGKPEKWLGWGNYFGITFDEPVRGGLIWNVYDGNTLSAYGSANHLYVIKQGALYDITPQNLAIGNVDAATNTGWGQGAWGAGPWGGGWSISSGDAALPRVWTLARWGEDLMACPRGQPIYFWSYTAGPNLRLLSTGTASGSTTNITALSNDANIKQGDRVQGANIDTATYVSSINHGAHSLVLSKPTLGGFTGQNLFFTTPAVALSTLTADAALPTSALGIFVTDDRELVAFGAAVSPVVYDPLNIAWCNREDFTVWTASAVNTAGAIRCETGNRIMTAVRVFGGFLILTDISAHPFTFVGGDDIWSLDRIGSAGGCISPMAACEMDGVAYWMGQNTVFNYNGRVNQVACDVHEAVFGALNRAQTYKIVAGTNRKYGEVLWFVPTGLNAAGPNENDSYFGINSFDNSWEIGGALSGPGNDILSRTTWIDGNPLIPANPFGTDGLTFKLFQHESGITADGAPINYVLETGELELQDNNGTIQASDQFWRMKKFVPDYAYRTGQHALTVEARGYPQDAPVLKGPYDISTAIMMNPKARYKSARMLFSGTGDFRFGDLSVYAAPDGGRL